MPFTNGDHSDPNWWRQATVYQIYPRSFADANGDGIGDLKGITSKVPYLEKLGVDAVWLSPFYPSALKDGGYDVADYRNVDPKIGTLEDFDEMTAAFKKVGIKVIVDIVPNHSSDDHVWFQEAIRSPKGSAARDRYIFKEGKGADKSEPPNDWECAFGGSAWEAVGDGTWYLHMFDTSQPDWNWDNRQVRDDFLETLRFWADRGVAGFRVDVAHALMKDMREPYLSQEEAHALQMEQHRTGEKHGLHPLWDRTEVHEIYQEWRKLFNEYNPPLTAVAEAWVAPNRNHRYASSEGLGQCFSFDMLMCSYDAGKVKQLIDQQLEQAKESGSSTTWVLSNHDVIRHATRYASDQYDDVHGPKHFGELGNVILQAHGKNIDPAKGSKRARAASLMMLALPGSTYLYQGEELGLPEVFEISDDQRQDPVFFRNKGKMIGRDGCRVPLPWTKSGASFGFSPDSSTNKPPHLPMPQWMGAYSPEALESNSESTLNLYRKALELKRQLIGPEEVEWVGEEDGVVHFKRKGGWEVVMNYSNEQGVKVPSGRVLVASASIEGGVIPPNTTVWVQSE